LEDAGFSVDVIQGDQINVEFYRKLAAKDYHLIIFRVHSTMKPGTTEDNGTTYLFTNEPYDKTKYVSHQLAGQVMPACLDENNPEFFAVSADYLTKYGEGRFNKSVIIMMGCLSLITPDMAESFISQGALFYCGWTGSVKLDYVDDFTLAFLANLTTDNTTFKQACYLTADVKGPDPTYHTIFSYYPTENEDYSLSSIK
jgi:hypothetical protein